LIFYSTEAAYSLKKNRIELCGVIVVLAMNPSYWAGPCIGNIIYKYVLTLHDICSVYQKRKKKEERTFHHNSTTEKNISFFHRGQNLKFKPIIEIPYENA